jgi:hypothetical protein
LFVTRQTTGGHLSTDRVQQDADPFPVVSAEVHASPSLDRFYAEYSTERH